MDETTTVAPLSSVENLEKTENQLSAAIVLMALSDMHVRERDVEENFLPEDVLGEGLGLNLNMHRERTRAKSLDARGVDFPNVAREEEIRDIILVFLRSLTDRGELSIDETGRVLLTAAKSLVPLVRACAVASIQKIFTRDSAQIFSRLQWFKNRVDEIGPESRAVIVELESKEDEDQLPSTGETAIQPIPPTLLDGQKRLVLVHGTHFGIFPDPSWYVPGIGAFHKFILGHRADLYSGNRPFQWEGSLNQRGRRVASENLIGWLDQNNMFKPDVIAHSHGANVVMQAAEMGCKFGKTIFCSCPVQWSKYNFNSGNIDQAISVRVGYDLVVAATGSAQTFPIGSGVEDYRVNGFSHSNSRLPKPWDKAGLPKKVL